MTDATAFANRLAKNARHFHRWARTRGLTAYRLYDRDMPEFPYAVDWYAGRVQLADYPKGGQDSSPTLEGVVEAALQVLEVPPQRLYVKTRRPHAWGKSQYERLGAEREPFTVEEQGLKFWVDLTSHLDTGLFLDHRLTRARVREEARGKRFLNLFAYTGSFTVYAAAGGAAETTSVDLSNTYLDVARRNLASNGLSGELVRADALRWLEAQRGARFDLIVLDPPPFSTSKGMRGSFDVQRDHPKLLERTLALLAPRGTLYFSTNYTGFQLEPAFRAEELTPGSIPDDFRRKDIHRCWRFTGTGG